jgi:Tfp pilus assembly protein PilF
VRSTVKMDAKAKINLAIFEGLAYCEAKEYNKAENILRKTLQEDVSNDLDFVGHFILICCYIRNNKLEKATKVFQEVPIGTYFSPAILVPFFRFLEIDSFLLEALDGLMSIGGNIQIKAKYFKAEYSYSKRINRTEINIETLKQIKDDFQNAIELFGIRKSEIYESLYFVLEDMQKWVDAAYYYFLSQIHGNDDAYSPEMRSSVLEAIYKNQKNIVKLFSAIDKVLDDNSYLTSMFSKKCLPQLISFFHSKEKYDLVVKLEEKFSYGNIISAGCVFEVAFAYNRVGNKKKAKYYYRSYLRDVGENYAVANNLGVLEEEDGNLAEAEKLFQLAIKLEPNYEIGEKNHARVITRIQKEEEQRNAYKKAIDLYQQELEPIRFLACKLYSIKTNEDLIFYSAEKMASITGIESSEIDIQVKQFIKKKYFEEISNESLQFKGKLLRPNPVLVPVLQSDLNKIDEKDAIKAITNDLLSASLDAKYGYNQNLLDCLKAIKSKELSIMLERDLNETVISLAIKSYKSALILSGSIAEAVLLDNLVSQKEVAIKALESLLSKENKKIKNEDKRLDHWGLERMLDVALEIKLISENLYHWGHGIRGFRNLVHPGVEQRKSIEISRENAEMAWNVIRRLLSEIDDNQQSI